jgi:LytTr DNA-binding domain
MARSKGNGSPSVPSRMLGIGFVYWLVFLLVLEPGNVLRFAEGGLSFPFVHEAIRIVGAALLGMAATPFLIPFQPLGSAEPFGRRLSKVGLFVVGNAGISFGLILTSCVLAAWGFQRQLLPSLEDVGFELGANWSLVGFAVFALACLLSWPRRQTSNPKATADKISIREGRDMRLIDLKSVIWIESKGNHIAIHERNQSHLVRRPLSDFVTELDPGAFFRVHRRIVVALREVKSIGALPNGDAEARLNDDRCLRVSRRNRQAFQNAWIEFHGTDA